MGVLPCVMPHPELQNASLRICARRGSMSRCTPKKWSRWLPFGAWQRPAPARNGRRPSQEVPGFDFQGL